MSETRVRCARPRCRNTILPATAARTGGICRPCEQEIAREEHEAYVRANRREVDPFAGVTDPVEIVKLLIRPYHHDELLVEKPYAGDAGDLFASLGSADIERMIDLALDSDKVALWLATFTDAKLDRVQRAFAEGEDLPYAIVFRGAPRDVRDRLFEIAASDPQNRNRALVALAWVGDDVVVEHFAREQSLRTFAREAGWELDANDRRRDLFEPVAHALVKGEGEAVVDVGAKTPGRCPSCRGPLTTLLHQPQRVVICVTCTTYGPSRKPEPPPWEKPARLVLGRRRGMRHAAAPFLPTTASQLGGLPGWLQDAAYAPCPRCKRTMTFLGQVSVEELEDPAEGMFYAMGCRQCGTTATVYQQT